MSATIAYNLSCEAVPRGFDACGTNVTGPAGCTLEQTRAIAANAGWRLNDGQDVCPECTRNGALEFR